MVQNIVDSQPRSRAYPRAQVEVVRPTLEHVIELVLCEFDETVEDLRRKNRRPGRKAFAALAHREAGLTYRMIAEYLEVSPPAISKMIETSADLERKDRGFRRSMERIRRKVS